MTDIDSAGLKTYSYDDAFRTSCAWYLIHHLQSRSAHAATVLEIGTRRPADDEAFYPDIDLHALKGDAGYAHRDGRPYPPASVL